MFRKLVAAFIVIAGLPCAGSAADLRTPIKASTKPAQIYDWSGFYIGGHVGYGWGNADASLPSAFFLGDPQFRYQDMTGPMAGGHIGYNYQMNWAVLGIEGDFGWSGIRERGVSTTAGGQTVWTADVNWLATLRGRAGVVLDSLMIYGTGGAAWTDLNLSTQSSLAPNLIARNWFDKDSITHFGWVAGGGIEWMASPNWIFRAEYLHYSFESQTHYQPSFQAGLDYTIDIDVIRGGVSYKF